ncbi:hypothetical protein [Priestia megaterium]|uniref:hypothetical protein n=1 Tax=Priestia megaterium TaxID=1404 RepID=UPI000BFBAB4C|nr:hypothetical protein [Priestia megaterium]MBW0934203.1 hypothetical protein [Priestia megaterium]PGX80597.1 hypothetical protein COE31_04575 [Priestia megaterium]
MKGALKNSFIVVLMILVVFLSFSYIKNLTENRSLAIRIGSTKITNKEVNQYLKENYWKQATNDIINEKLIKQAAIKEKVQKPSKQEIEKEAEILLENHEPRGDLSKEENIEYVKDRVITKKLEKKLTVTDNELKQFLNENEGKVGESVYSVLVYKEKNLQKINNLTNELNEGKSVEEISKKYNIKFTTEKIEKNNKFHIDVSKLETDKAQVINDSYEPMIVVVTNIQNKVVKSINHNKEGLKDFYLEKKYYMEKVHLINYLRSKQNIEVNWDVK